MKYLRIENKMLIQLILTMDWNGLGIFVCAAEAELSE